MLSLLNNYCINLIELDEEGGDNTGEIYFLGGEDYIGEIKNNLPLGQGTLKMKDGSSFKGNFDSKTLQEGEFNHFTGFRYKGSFNRDRFLKGTIYFLDGDKLKGEWFSKKGRWVLKKGTLYDDEKTAIYEFNS